MPCGGELCFVEGCHGGSTLQPLITLAGITPGKASCIHTGNRLLGLSLLSPPPQETRISLVRKKFTIFISLPTGALCSAHASFSWVTACLVMKCYVLLKHFVHLKYISH